MALFSSFFSYFGKSDDLFIFFQFHHTSFRLIKNNPFYSELRQFLNGKFKFIVLNKRNDTRNIFIKFVVFIKEFQYFCLIVINQIIFKHALRNSLIPVITYAGPQIAYIITGSMVIETIFTVGGLGSKFVSAINNRDYTMIMATTIFLATLMVIANLICDLLYKLVDPRIKYE